MANLYLGHLNDASSLRRLFAFDGFDIQFVTEMTSSLITMEASDGSILLLTGNFSSLEQSEWEISSIALAQDDISILSISDISLSVDLFETLSGKELAQTLLAGNDEISIGFNENLTVRTYSGDDLITLGDGNNAVYSGIGRDTLQGGNGQDMLVAGNGADHLAGEGGNDTLLGGKGGDTAVGGAGEDTLKGNGGNDWLSGGGGNDRVLGGGGRDSLLGGYGHDTLFGGNGHDRIQGQKGSDVLTGGSGRDTFVFNRDDGHDTITDFELGIDHIQIGRGASSFGQLDFDQQGNDVLVSFRNVEITIEDITVDQIQQADNFLFV